MWQGEVPVLQDGDLLLRNLRMRDARALEHVLITNRAWLSPWEATLPGGAGRWNVRGSVRSLLDQQSANTAIPYLLESGGKIVGQLTVSSMQFGAVLGATIGYWVAADVAGRGFAPTAVAMATDYCFGSLGLHRMEICIRPENDASLRVVEKLGFRYEGRRDKYIHIDGDWRDHYCFALTADEAPEGVLNRWKDGRVDPRAAQRPPAGPFA